MVITTSSTRAQKGARLTLCFISPHFRSIRSWNDPALVESNPALQIVEQPLSVMVHPEVAAVLVRCPLSMHTCGHTDDAVWSN